MQTNELYRRYLLADRLAKIMRAIAEETGLDTRAHGFEFGKAYNPDKADWYWDYDVRLSLLSHHLEPEGRELIVEQLLRRLPELNLVRADGEMRLHGVVNGLLVRSYGGAGVCERVKVGTRVVPAKPATEEYVEDVYEVRCPDPITAMQNA